ncbi:LexA family protein [Gimesia maris]|uniref:LexA repressor n=1 Tax=Gimesia maris TaxID=122 RepID=A0ABX5YPD5_9PLAN|nr:hypothetical protein [Gimesia maris]EDL58414.1 hypothetical protein PM8797T_27200 [Gimesia maris DSM 8797]QDT79819.1 LexA repressor [Gimesia maris]QDU15442.1 LexA repressor [Gimesia maris]QEG17495.1 LexA repressor [Gimesia maris]QGQ29440.1 hypothetical protein F1729_12650 [Gimesia maris]|tara:strand:+ start:47218 stop:47505 length:288 start_codon:yes stop_codon:yes gene_type:complete
MNQYLTERQQKILDYITREIDRSGIAPNTEQIASEFEIPSLNRVTQYLHALEGKGWITCNASPQGGIALVENGNSYRLAVCGDVEGRRVAFKKSS